MPLSFFGLYTPETRLMLDAYAGFLDRLREGPEPKGTGGLIFSFIKHQIGVDLF